MGGGGLRLGNLPLSKEATKAADFAGKSFLSFRSFGGKGFPLTRGKCKQSDRRAKSKNTKSFENNNKRTYVDTGAGKVVGAVRHSTGTRSNVFGREKNP